MADEKQLSILKQGVETWNRWRKENEEAWVNLREADLKQADLSGANLTGAHLAGLEGTYSLDATLGSVRG